MIIPVEQSTAGVAMTAVENYMQKKFSLFCFDEHQPRDMSQKGKGAKKKQPANHQAAIAKAVKEARKRWEFNLIKTGNNQVNWNSGNTLGAKSAGARSRSIRPISGGMALGAPATVGGSTELAVTNAVVRTRDQIVEQDEVIGIMNGSTGFEANTLDVNPGLAAVFPWLSQLAALYERYSFDELVFYYKALGSGFAANNQTGKVIICADYDAAESTPASYRQAETMDPHADGMPFQCIELHLDPRRLNKEPKFIRLGPPPPSTDVKTYDAANVYYCASATPNASEIGELRVRYRVRLMNPRLPGISAQVTPNNTSAVFQTAVGTALLLTSNTWNKVTLDQTPVNGINATVSGTPLTRVALLQGNYAITFRAEFNNVGASALSKTITYIRENGASDAAADHISSEQWKTVLGTATSDYVSQEVTKYVTVTGAGSYYDFSVLCVFGGGAVDCKGYVLIRSC